MPITNSRFKKKVILVGKIMLSNNVISSTINYAIWIVEVLSSERRKVTIIKRLCNGKRTY